MMSREFGSYTSGYFDTQIETAAYDCLGGHYEHTRLWGEFLKEFSEVAYGIASAEAYDWSEGGAVIRSIRHFPAIRQALKDIEEYLKPFQDVADEAVRKAIDK